MMVKDLKRFQVFLKTFYIEEAEEISSIVYIVGDVGRPFEVD